MRGLQPLIASLVPTALRDISWGPVRHTLKVRPVGWVGAWVTPLSLTFSVDVVLLLLPLQALLTTAACPPQLLASSRCCSWLGRQAACQCWP